MSTSPERHGCTLNWMVAVAASVALAACGGGGGGGGGTSGFALGGTVAGLGAGKQVLLLSGAGTQLLVKASGNFRFNEGLPAGARYTVTIGENPVGQTCEVRNGSNSGESAGVKADVTNVTVVCADNTLPVSGVVSGLPAGASLTLTNGPQSQLTVSANGTFTLPVRVAQGAPYAVTVDSQPNGAICTVNNGSGTVGAAGVTAVDVRCTPATFTVGGSVSGLTSGATLALRLNEGAPLTLAANGLYSFAAPVVFGSSYRVTVSTQPDGQLCTVANGESASASASVTNVQVVCASRQYRISGSVTGLSSVTSGQRLVLRNNGSDDLTVDAPGRFTFTQPVAHGSVSNVTVARQPVGQTCSVVGGSAASVTAEVTSIQILCVAVVWRTSSVAGSGAAASVDGIGALASFHGPAGMALDPMGRLLVADASSSRIRRITLPQGVVTTIAGGPVAGYVNSSVSLSAAFQGPGGVAVDAQGNIFVADTLNHSIRRISAVDGAVSTLAGNGQAGATDGAGSAARFNAPRGLTVDRTGQVIVADSGNHAIRQISPDGTVTTIAGQLQTRGRTDGPAASALFSGPAGVAVDAAGSIYVADTQNALIRVITTAGGARTVRTVAGSGLNGLQDGEGVLAAFSLPSGVALDSSGNLVVADTGNHLIRYVQMTGSVGTVMTIAGSGQAGSQDGVGAGATFSSPTGLAVVPGGMIYITESAGQRVRSLFRASN